ncbi:unnamed protein product [Paramecium pentaurelia]|uniref:Uncharacterized protein n=1 Tax=Paramecium pentaurelia TaxID=43138 RepID=A0A8S1TEX6_9CILI|nr:unnamed protein product [Paramecium pentaurelia]
MYDISNIFKRCIEEKITILTGRSSRADRSLINSSMMMSRVKTKDNYYQFNESNSFNKYNVELNYQTELEYNPKFLIKNKEKMDVLSDCSEYYELPKISHLEQQSIKKYSMCNSQHDSSGITSRKNTYKKYRQISNRLKAVKVGYLSLDPDSPYTQEIFKQLSNSNIYQEITKPQLVNYLASQLGCQTSVQKLINLMQLPYSITQAVYRSFLLQIREMSQQQIIQLVFSCYDVMSKTYLNTRDLFELFKAGGAAQKDADIIFKYLRFKAIRNPFDMHTTISTQKKVKQKPQKQMVITMMKDKVRKLSEMYNRKHTYDNNVVSETTFLEIYQNTIPEFFKFLVQLLANYNCD